MARARNGRTGAADDPYLFDDPDQEEAINRALGGGAGAGASDPNANPQATGQLTSGQYNFGENDLRPGFPYQPAQRQPQARSRPLADDRQRAYDTWLRSQSGKQPFDEIANAYKQFLGREGTNDEYYSHLMNPYGLGEALALIASSPEADTYWQSQSTGGAGGGGGGGNTGTGYPTTLPTPGNLGGLTGYPTDLGRSMKHVFGAIQSRYGPDYGDRAARMAAILGDPDFRAWFPNAHQVANDDDLIDFGGQLSDFEEGVPVNLVDIFRGGDDMGQWIDQNFVGQGSSGGGGGASGADAANLADNRTVAIGQALQGSPQGSFSMLDALIRAMATNKLFDPTQNYMLGR